MRLRRFAFFTLCAIVIFIPGCPSPGSGALPPPQTSANTFQPRNNYGALLEPPDTVIHGAGQSDDAFLNYVKALGAGRRPVIYKAYIGLEFSVTGFFDWLKARCDYYASAYGVYLIPEIGLSMTTDGHSELHYEGDVAAGLYDDKIEDFCRGLETLGHPAFVRIGFEFNGLSWNGYEPATYIAAYRRITVALRAHNLEAATVWCAAFPLNFTPYTYMDYYPGDSYVDWWGIDPFDAVDFTSADMNTFMAAAATAQKPVMIGETTPRYVGVTDGQADWDAWFEPFFAFIQSHPGVKAFGYIDWNWADYPQWSTWGDARIETNPQVLSNYIYKVSSPLYLHGAGEQALRAALGATDTTPPGQVTGLSGAFNTYTVDLSWNAATDDVGVVRYEVFADGTKIGNATGLTFSDSDLSAGTSPSYTVRAVDAGGNPGPLSDPEFVTIPDPLEKIVNGEFDDGASPWQADAWNGAALTFSIDNGSLLSGVNSAQVVVTAGTGTAWHAQLRQFFHTRAGKRYRLRFSAYADAATSIDVMLQQSHDPYGWILSRSVNLTTSPQSFEFTDGGTAADDTLYATFMAGSSGGRTIWIDAVSVEESN
ncbi:MAG: carbohydrate binding domain-containing protein [Spirochaetales bacterium]|nr:carbohydrate binding domain-containing protein [Spirochaetales bacterium]